jgi:hypothetical protein
MRVPLSVEQLEAMEFDCKFSPESDEGVASHHFNFYWSHNKGKLKELEDQRKHRRWFLAKVREIRATIEPYERLRCPECGVKLQSRRCLQCELGKHK